MKLFRILLTAIVVISGLLFTAGCDDKPIDSTIPWTRPAEWENQVPGMGG